MKNQRTWNSKLIVTLGGISSITIMACLGVISGGVALPAISGLVVGYTAYRQITKKTSK